MAKNDKSKKSEDTDTVTETGLLAASMEGLSFLGADVFIEDKQYGPLYPIVQWQNGSPQRKTEGGLAYEGGFFCSSEQGLVLPNSKKHTLITRGGDEIDGYQVRDLDLAVIRTRKVWVVGEGRDAMRFANEEYDMAVEAAGGPDEKPPTGHTQILCQTRGLDEAFVITLKGNMAKAVTGNTGKQRGIIPTFAQVVVNAASRISGANGKQAKKFPLCAFYVKIGADRNADGSPVFTEVGSEESGGTSMTTLPAWIGRPAEIGTAEIEAMFVGNDFTKYQTLHQASADWEKAWSLEAIQTQRARREGKPAAGAPGAAAAGENGKSATGIPF